MPNLGSPILMSATYRDASGAPVDPTNVVLTITLPDQTTITPAPVHASTGVFTYNYISTMRGHGSWAYTSDNYGGIGDVFNVQLPAQTLVSVTDAKKHINYDLTDSTDDDEIRDMLRSVSAEVQSDCGYCLPTSITESADINLGGQSSIVVTQWPVLSVDAVTPLMSNSGQATVDVSKAQVNALGGVFFLNSGVPFYGPYAVTYTAGRVDSDGHTYVPDDLQELTLILFKWMWETQRGSTPSGVAGFGSDGDEAEGGRYGHPLPDRAMYLKQRYLRPNV
jgi:hypothetical protein